MIQKLKIEGGCLCGNIRYLITQKPKHQTLCHCIDCRKAAGAQSVAWIIVALKQFQFTLDAPSVFHSSRHVKRTFCQNCGTTLTYQEKDRPTMIDVTTGSLDNPELFAPDKDVFLSDKLNWVQPIKISD